MLEPFGQEWMSRRPIVDPVLLVAIESVLECRLLYGVVVVLRLSLQGQRVWIWGLGQAA